MFPTFLDTKVIFIKIFVKILNIVSFNFREITSRILSATAGVNSVFLRSS